MSFYKKSISRRSFLKALGLFSITGTLSACGTVSSSATSSEAVQDSISADVESTLNLANNSEQSWSYDSVSDAWVLSIVSAVAYPELPDQQGVSVCVPGAYVKGIDTTGDGTADKTASDAVNGISGHLVIDYDASITSTNGQVYTAKTAPIVLNTGAAGYGSQQNQLASTEYAADGYINVACGNRGKQDTVTGSDGTSYYTGDAPSCLVDQKAAARFVKYNILLGNLPGDPDKLVSTGGSGGGAHAVMFAATADQPDFYPYLAEVGAVGVTENSDGSYNTTVTVNGSKAELSDGAWGCIAYSAITSLKEADMALAFEYNLNPNYSFNTPFQAALAGKLAEAYREYINAQNLTVSEAAVGIDLDGDGVLNSFVPLTIEYDLAAHPDTNGYYGSYLDLYHKKFKQQLQWYLDNLDYADGWTWFGADGNALTDEQVAAMTTTDKAQAFLAGRYAKSSSGSMGGPGMGGGAPGGMQGSTPPDENAPMGDPPTGDMKGSAPGGASMLVGTPDAGTTQSASSQTDSTNYSTYEEMLTAYQNDIASVTSGDRFGKNQVELYNPLHYIRASNATQPVWSRIMMGAAEGDMALLCSLNLQLAWLNAGVDATLQWQWDGGHVPSEVLGESFSLYLDEMFAKYVEASVAVEKPAAVYQTKNGTETAASGTDRTTWVTLNSDGQADFTLAAAAAYRTAGASKAMPGFDVIDYGQEDYVFGSKETDARHWDSYLLTVLEENREELEPLFNQSAAN